MAPCKHGFFTWCPDCDPPQPRPAGEPRTEAGRRLLDEKHAAFHAPLRGCVEPCSFMVSILAIEDEAARDAGWVTATIEVAEDPSRAAITAAVADIRGRHVLWHGYCLLCHGRWPCPDALLADRLEEVMGD